MRRREDSEREKRDFIYNRPSLEPDISETRPILNLSSFAPGKANRIEKKTETPERSKEMTKEITVESAMIIVVKPIENGS
jgi:hypothetical protein